MDGGMGDMRTAGERVPRGRHGCHVDGTGATWTVRVPRGRHGCHVDGRMGATHVAGGAVKIVTARADDGVDGEHEGE